MSKEIANLTVSGMSCSHCENSIKKSVGSLEGVDSVNVDLKSKKVLVEYDTDKVNFETIIEIIEDQGYDVEK
ncbi:MAG TPA: copper chaperone CopZ [Acetivibrio sp.]|nr:copper chaperone CopZ [Acetivibrio sp.]